jgi:HD-like signal output (HDOD) protein
MRIFTKPQPSPVLREPVVPKPPVLEGWSESDVVTVYKAARVRYLKKGDSLFSDVEGTESFYILLDGSLQAVVKWDGHMGRPGLIHRGDCMAPLPKSPGLLYCADAVESCTVIELTPTVLNYLPPETQLCVYKVAIKATSRINAYIRAVNGEVTAKNAKLASYIAARQAQRRLALESEEVRKFLSGIPRLPSYAIDLGVRLLDETTSVQEVVDGIKRDPAVAALVLRVVNSAQYGLVKRIETFYHACMILGFNNLSTLIMREAVESTMSKTKEAQKIHVHSCLISLLCYEISLVCKDLPGQTVMTLGLLHDLGKGIQILMKRSGTMAPQYIDTLDSAKLGADLLRGWGLPERVCFMVENQETPEFNAPDLVPAEYRKEVGLLHLAHVLESLIMGTSKPESTIYLTDYMALLGLGNTTAEELLKERIIPSLNKNKQRFPKAVQAMIAPVL